MPASVTRPSYAEDVDDGEPAESPKTRLRSRQLPNSFPPLGAKVDAKQYHRPKSRPQSFRMSHQTQYISPSIWTHKGDDSDGPSQLTKTAESLPKKDETQGQRPPLSRTSDKTQYISPSIRSSLKFRGDDGEPQLIQNTKSQPYRTVPSLKRTYSLGECRSCQVRGIKCDQGLPACEPCKRSHVICNYPRYSRYMKLKRGEANLAEARSLGMTRQQDTVAAGKPGLEAEVMKPSLSPLHMGSDSLESSTRFSPNSEADYSCTSGSCYEKPVTFLSRSLLLAHMRADHDMIEEEFQEIESAEAAIAAMAAEDRIDQGNDTLNSSRQRGKIEKGRYGGAGSNRAFQRPVARIATSQGTGIDANCGMEGRKISLRQTGEGEGKSKLEIGSLGRTIGSQLTESGGKKSQRRYSNIENRREEELSRPLIRASKSSDLDEDLARKALKAENEAQAEGREISPFVQGLSRLLARDAPNTVHWTESGDSFIVTNEVRCARFSVPNFRPRVGTDNFSTLRTDFAWQLNLHGFIKEASSDPCANPEGAESESTAEYSHPYFRRGKQNLLWLFSMSARDQSQQDTVHAGGVEGDSVQNLDRPTDDAVDHRLGSLRIVAKAAANRTGNRDEENRQWKDRSLSKMKSYPDGQAQAAQGGGAQTSPNQSMEHSFSTENLPELPLDTGSGNEGLKNQTQIKRIDQVHAGYLPHIPLRERPTFYRTGFEFHLSNELIPDGSSLISADVEGNAAKTEVSTHSSTSSTSCAPDTLERTATAPDAKVNKLADDIARKANRIKVSPVQRKVGRNKMGKDRPGLSNSLESILELLRGLDGIEMTPTDSVPSLEKEPVARREVEIANETASPQRPPNARESDCEPAAEEIRESVLSEDTTNPILHREDQQARNIAELDSSSKIRRNPSVIGLENVKVNLDGALNSGSSSENGSPGQHISSNAKPLTLDEPSQNDSQTSIIASPGETAAPFSRPLVPDEVSASMEDHERYSASSPKTNNEASDWSLESVRLPQPLMSIGRGDTKAASEQTKAEFDSALDKAIETAHHDDVEQNDEANDKQPVNDPRDRFGEGEPVSPKIRNVEPARESADEASVSTKRLPEPNLAVLDKTKHEAKNLPICWDHGCNGRRFSTFSNLLRHARACSTTAKKFFCPRCGVEFVRSMARDRHILYECKPPSFQRKCIKIADVNGTYLSSNVLPNTPCQKGVDGDWISKDLVQRLGKVNEIEAVQDPPCFESAEGEEILACGAICLRWRFSENDQYLRFCKFNVVPWSSPDGDVLFGVRTSMAAKSFSERSEEVQYNDKDHTSGAKIDSNEEPLPPVTRRESKVNESIQLPGRQRRVSDIFENDGPNNTGLADQDVESTESEVSDGKAQDKMTARTTRLIEAHIGNSKPRTDALAAEEDHLHRERSSEDRIDQRAGESISYSNETTDKPPVVTDAAPRSCNEDSRAALYNVQITKEDDRSFANYLKLRVEDLTGETWDWWPLRPSLKPLESNQSRISWRCASGHVHKSEVGDDKIPLFKKDIKPHSSQPNQPGASISQAPSTRAYSESSASSDSDRHCRAESSASQTSSATSDTGSLDDSDEEHGSKENEDPGKGSPNDRKDVIVNITPPSTLKGFVLFGVLGAPCLQPAKTRLTQIDVEACKDDDKFFDELAIQFKRLRGIAQSTGFLGVLTFEQYYKSNPNEILAGPEELPSVSNEDYVFKADRDPPILESLFEANFYGCKKACMKARIDVLRIFHECAGRNHCGKCWVLDRLPKRRWKWEIDRDDEKDEAWGLHATFGVSGFRVLLYHFLILAGPALFWGLWLERWPRDWQNASIPFFAVVVFLSFFWLPFAHNAGSNKAKKRKVA